MLTESVPGTVAHQERKCHKMCRNHGDCRAVFVKVKFQAYLKQQDNYAEGSWLSFHNQTHGIYNQMHSTHNQTQGIYNQMHSTHNQTHGIYNQMHSTHNQQIASATKHITSTAITNSVYRGLYILTAKISQLWGRSDRLWTLWDTLGWNWGQLSQFLDVINNVRWVHN